MKKNIFSFLISISLMWLTTATLSSCSDEDYLGGHYTADGAGTEVKVTAQMAQDAGAAFAEGSKIAVSTSYGSSDATARNREYICGADGSTFTAAADLPIYVKGNCNIVAYYPFEGENGAENVISLSTLNQNSIKQYYFAKSDTLSSSSSAVILQFHSAYSKLSVNITAPAGEEINSWRLSGFAQTATVNQYTLGETLGDVQDLTGKGTNLNNLTITLIPQTIAEGADTPATLVLIGKKRTYRIDLGAVTLTAGETLSANVDVTSGTATVEFTHNGGQWNNSGAGGNISSH